MTVVLTLRNLLHFFWPLRCAFCAKPLPPNRRTDHLYCSDCRKQLRPAQTLTLPRLKLCLIYTTYTKSVARAVYRLKFHNQPQLADTMAELMAKRLGGKILACRPDCICGVAMHPLKQRRRGYNQADELAAHLARRLKIPCATLLEKRKNTAAQHTLSAEKRRSNLKGALSAAGVRKAHPAGGRCGDDRHDPLRVCGGFVCRRRTVGGSGLLCPSAFGQAACPLPLLQVRLT